MRVLIDTTYARRAPLSGTGVYLERLCQALTATGAVEVVRADNPRRRRPAGGGIGSLRNAATDEWWASVELPRRARAAGAELIHHPLPARSHRCPLPQVVTVHDLAFERFPRDFAPAFRAYGQLIHRRAASKAAAIIAVSHTTAADLGELWGISGPRVVVAPHGPGQELPVLRREPAHFLYVGDEEPRKDLPTLLAAHARYRERGGRVPLVRAQRGASAQRLAELHAGAVALVHPARYEGFGLTVLEAMSLGTPVVAAACPAIVELTGGTARLYPPGDIEALATALTEPPDPARVAGARARAAGYSWARSAEQHLAAYSFALGR